mmetsp:Transcript_11856/g.21652  ORF Transcript_11856/g.21652 Transcript_11856/m.21652 type:complete len:125 (-) Transcript_11856:170-544(-)
MLPLLSVRRMLADAAGGAGAPSSLLVVEPQLAAELNCLLLPRDEEKLLVLAMPLRDDSALAIGGGGAPPLLLPRPLGCPDLGAGRNCPELEAWCRPDIFGLAGGDRPWELARDVGCEPALAPLA